MNLEKLAQTWFNLYTIRKYPLCRYILGVLMHTTAWYRLWGDDETERLVLQLYVGE